MALAQKFEFLDKQTNAPLVDLEKVTGKEIFNTIDNAVKDIPAAIASLSDSLKDKVNAEGIKEQISDIKDKVKQSLQEGAASLMKADGALSSIIEAPTKFVKNSINQVNSLLDMNKMADKINSALSGILPAGVSSNFFKTLTKQCLGDFGKFGQIGNLFGSAGKSASSCASTAVNGLMDAITGSKTKLSSINSLITATVNVSSAAYKNNITGVFNKVVQSNPDMKIQHTARAAAGVVSDVSQRGDVYGFSDMAKHSVGLNVPSIVPNAGSTLLKNLDLGTERDVLKQSQIALAGLDAYGYLDLDKPASNKYSLTETDIKNSDVNSLLKVSSMSGSSKSIDSFSNSNPLSEIAYTVSSSASSMKSSFNSVFKI